jgi:hypothetical protein
MRQDLLACWETAAGLVNAGPHTRVMHVPPGICRHPAGLPIHTTAAVPRLVPSDETHVREGVVAAAAPHGDLQLHCCRRATSDHAVAERED